jgi:hypothetical protein
MGQARARITDTRTAIGDKRDDVVGKAREISPDSALAAASTGTQKAIEVGHPPEAEPYVEPRDPP